MSLRKFLGLEKEMKPIKASQTVVPTIVKGAAKKENQTASEDSVEPEEYEIVEKEILPEKMICPDCGGITLAGLDFCDKCGGELAGYENF